MYNGCIQNMRELREMIIKNIKLWLKNIYKKLVFFLKEIFEEAWIGGKFALIGFVIITFVITGVYLDTGLGNGVDVLFCTLLGGIFIFLSKIVSKILIRVLKNLPSELLYIVIPTTLTIAAVVSLILNFPVYLGIIFSLIIVTVESFLGIGLWIMFKRKVKRILASVLVGITLAINIAGIVEIRSTGNINNQLREYLFSMKSVQAKQSIQSPAKEGKYKVKTIFYGSGKDKNRFEYGEGVDIKTKDVYAYNFLENYTGLKSKLRTKYWGFNDKAMPINGRVYYPEGEGVFPLVLIVHGNHKMEEYSDKGYEYLGKLLASQGFIVASIDENFLNASWFGDLGGENDARAWFLLKHLDTWKEFNEDEKNIFYNKVDFNNIALIGHSRGGEAAATAAVFNKLKYYPMDAAVRFNFNYNIKSIVAIAPTDGQYKPADKPTEIKNVNYLLLQGANDGDVSVFMGSNQYDRVKFDDGKYHFKSSIYIYGANHGQFNTAWGKRDIPEPLGWLLNLKPLLSGEEQRSIAKSYISAFLKSTLKEEKEYIALFKDYSEGEKFLPKTVYINRFQDSNFKLISNYEEDADLQTSTLSGGVQNGEEIYTWKEKTLEFRSDFSRNNNAVELKWTKNGGKYIVELPQKTIVQWNINYDSKLVFSASDIDEEKIKSNIFDSTDFSIKLIDSNGEEAIIPLSNIGKFHPPIGVKLSKWDYHNKRAYGEDFEPVLQTFQIAIGDFAKSNPRFTPKDLKTIEFIFNKSVKGNIVVDDIGVEI